MLKNYKFARNRALVVGSVAFDVLFDVHGTIHDRIVIKKGKLGKQNLMFTARDKNERYGGVGANIAYGLGLLGAKPILFASAGKDFKHGFEKHLRKYGVDARVHVEKDAWTAVFYGMSDESREQIGVWQSNAHDMLGKISIVEKLGAKNLKDVTVAIFSGAPATNYNHIKAVRKLLGKHVRIILDPGKMILSGDKTVLKDCLRLSNIFIVNDTELHQTQTLLGCSADGIVRLGPSDVIETKGGEGSIIHESGKTTRVSAFKPKRVVETTGAGDAYRAGLMYGLLQGLDLPAACRIGSYLGAKNVETRGGQMYRVKSGEWSAK